MNACCNLPIILLAAGQSSRMRGRDKLLEEVDGQPLIRRQAQIASAATDAGVYVTLPANDTNRLAALASCDVATVPVADAHLGMSASLRAGLAALPRDVTATMVLLADLPELTTEDLCHLCAHVDVSSDTRIWRGATDRGAPGHPIVFARSLFPELSRLEGDIGGSKVIERHKDKVTLVRLTGNRARLDLDTPEAWAAWRSGRSRDA